ncbi:MAG: T9SS type A sorting domain-containing protein [Bacteroidota bacterium]
MNPNILNWIIFWGAGQVTIVDEPLKKESGEISCNPLIPLELSATAFPNPFNPSTTFRVSLPQATNVRLAVYNMLGQKVATIIDGMVQAGYNDFHFDGSSLSSGIYLYRMEIAKEGEREIKSGKIMLMK